MAQGSAKKPSNDHGLLLGLSDDDHPQYLNDTRHNAAHGAIRVGLASDQTISSSASSTTIVFDTVEDEDDPDGDLTLNVSTGEITCNNAGWFMVVGGILWESNDTGRRGSVIFQNSTPVANNQVPADVFSPQTVSTLVKCSATDTLKLNAIQLSGGDLDVTAAPRTFFAVYKVREA